MSTAVTSTAFPRVKRWSKREYNEAVELGWFRRMKIFLYHGELVEMPPQGQPHAYAVTILTKYLARAFAEEFHIRIQCPFEVPGDSMPEPDACVVVSEQLRRFPHPNRAILVVEIADSSVRFDQELAAEYAGAVVPEYWVVDCQKRVVHVYSHLVDDKNAPHGKRYDSMRTFNETSELPLPLQRLTLKVKDLFL